MSGRVQCIVAYPSRTQSGTRTKFDMEYYLATHMVMIDEFWGPHGMKSWRVAQYPAENPLTGDEMPYIVQTTVEWDSIEDMRSALAAPESEKTRADIAKFTDVVPAIWVSNVAASKG